MPLPFSFATQPGPIPLSELDANFLAAALLGVIPCAVNGTNSLLFTPLGSSPATPSISAYQNYLVIAGIAVNANTSTTTAQIAGLGAVNVYKDTSSGPVALSGGEIQVGNIILLLYDSSLNSNAGGFHLQSAPSANTGTVAKVVASTGLAGGTITASGTISFASVSNLRLLANVSGGSAAPTPQTLSVIFDSILGSIQYGYPQRGASTWGQVGGVANGLSAAGTNQGTATSIAGQFNTFSTVGATQGAILAGGIGLPQTIWNQGANALLVYPPASSQIDGLGTNNPTTISTLSSGSYVSVSATQVRTLP